MFADLCGQEEAKLWRDSSPVGVLKFNPYHDELGHFASADSGKTASYTDKNGFSRSSGLGKSEAEIEQKFFDRLKNDPQAVVSEYRAVFGDHIDADNAKKLSPEYAANNNLAAAVHEPASALAKMVFTQALVDNEKNGNVRPVLFSAGGPGSGKSEALSTAKGVANIVGEPIVYDSVFSSFRSSTARVDEALAHGNHVNIIYTNRPIEEAFKFALGRPRTVPVGVIAAGHVNAANNIRAVSEKYKDNPNVTITVVNNFGGPADMKVGTLKDVPVYNLKEVQAHMHSVVAESHAKGEISDEKYAALSRSITHKRDFAGILNSECWQDMGAISGRERQRDRQEDGRVQKGGRLS